MSAVALPLTCHKMWLRLNISGASARQSASSKSQFRLVCRSVSQHGTTGFSGHRKTSDLGLSRKSEETSRVVEVAQNARRFAWNVTCVYAMGRNVNRPCLLRGMNWRIWRYKHLKLTFYNNNNNNNNNLLQLCCHPVAVVILHVNKTWNWLLINVSPEGYMRSM